MKRAYRANLHLSKSNVAKLEVVNEIIEQYATQGYSLTLRQLYYQLVSRDLIPNRKAEYDKLSRLLTKGRMAGVVDWDAIEDRIRVPKIEYSVDDIPDALQDTVSQYKLNLQQGQPTYIEVWCEKDALSNILERITDKYHIRLMVNRGYSSCTAMHDAHGRFARAAHGGQGGVILYIGDHDPSGLDMLRDIRERLLEFGDDVEVVPVALTKEQIDEHQPPPNYAKITDPRANDYIAEHGDSSWEVDALPPQVLTELVEQAVGEYLDEDKYDAMVERQGEDVEKLTELISQFGE